MRNGSARKQGTATTRKAPRQKKCPHCAELLGLRTIHICPVACCYVAAASVSLPVVCPYCGNSFETGVGHVCLELLKLTDPAQ